MIKAFSATLLILASLAAFMFWRSGYYKDVVISAGEQGPFLLVYRIHTGPYYKISEVLDEVEASLEKLQAPCPQAFGIYMHDPSEVDQDRLESWGGCAYPAGSLSPDKQKEIEAMGLLAQVRDKKEYVVAVFQGSPSLGPLKVYPKVKEWLAQYGYQQDGPIMELYQTLGADEVTTRYLFSYK